MEMNGIGLDIELIILAAVAVFVISRLYSVLGQKTGAEPQPRQVRDAAARPIRDEEESHASDDTRAGSRPAFTGPAAAGMEEIAVIDSSFDPDGFVHGARSAYEMIVAAFADGDRNALRPLVDDDVFEIYSAAIDQRESDKTEPMRLLRIKTARIAEASLDEQKIARVSVAFESELSDGENSRKAREIWTFKRSVEAKDPNWLLDEVQIAS